MSLWPANASINAIRARSTLSKQIREFFAERNVLEVETPLLYGAHSYEPQLQQFKLTTHDNSCKPLYLHTSPEFAMKRLLCTHGVSIYQICKVFRAGEVGRHHNPEFSMLEWYRVGWSLKQLYAEIEQLLGLCLGTNSLQIYTYDTVFKKEFGKSPHTISNEALSDIALKHGAANCYNWNTETLLDFLFTHAIQPNLGLEGPCIITEFPSCMACLAQLEEKPNYTVAKRFEVFSKGIELANGYDELISAETVATRWRQSGTEALEPDIHLLDALKAGMPACVGVALGLDRLLMLQLGASKLSDVLSFDWQRV